MGGRREAGRAASSGNTGERSSSQPLRTFTGRVLVAAQMPGSEGPFAASWLVSVSCDMTSPTPPTVTRKCLWFPSLLNAGLSVRPVPSVRNRCSPTCFGFSLLFCG